MSSCMSGARPLAESDGRRAGDLELRYDDHYERRWSSLTRQYVWGAARRRRPIAWIPTLLNAYVLFNAVKMIHSFSRLRSENYAISSLGDGAVGSAQCTASHGLQTDMARVLSSCREQLDVVGEEGGLHLARLLWYWAAVGGIGAALLCDALRLAGCAAPADALLGYHSARAESHRLTPFALLLLPFCHLSYWYTRPLSVPCCVATPLLSVALDRIRTLGFLLFVSGFCLIGDSHNHGYVLLRIPNARRSALSLLRGRLPEPARHDVVELLGPAEEPDSPDRSSETFGPELGRPEAALRGGAKLEDLEAARPARA